MQTSHNSSRMLIVGLVLFSALGTIGCSSSLFNFGKSRPFAKGEQWEPEVEANNSDWRSEAGKLGRGNRRIEKEDPVDKFLWSDQAKDINRNMGFR